MPQCNYTNIRRDLPQLKASECTSKNRKSNSENSIALFKIANESARKKMSAPAACNRKKLLQQCVHFHIDSAVWTRIARLQRLPGQGTENRRLAAAAVAEKHDLDASQGLRVLCVSEVLEN